MIRKKADDLRSFTLARRCKNIFVRGRQKLLINARRTRQWRLLCQYLNGSTINRGKNGSNEGIWFSRWWWLFMDSHGIPPFHPTFRPPTVYRPFVGRSVSKNVCQNPTLPRILRACCSSRHEGGNLRISGDEFRIFRPRICRGSIYIIGSNRSLFEVFFCLK